MARRPSLKSLSLSELITLRDQVQAALAARIEVERSDLQKRIETLSNIEKGAGEERGPVPSRDRRGPKSTRARGTAKRLSASTKPKRTAAKVAPKYRGPNGETWTGRGNTPRWLKALEADGKKRESFLIKA